MSPETYQIPLAVNFLDRNGMLDWKILEQYSKGMGYTLHEMMSVRIIRYMIYRISYIVYENVMPDMTI